MTPTLKIYDSITGTLIGVAELMSFSSERNVQRAHSLYGTSIDVAGRASHTCRFTRMMLPSTVKLDLMSRIETTITTDEFGVGRLAGYITSYSTSCIVSGGTIVLEDVQMAVDVIEPGFGFDQEAYEEYLESKFVF